MERPVAKRGVDPQLAAEHRTAPWQLHRRRAPELEAHDAPVGALEHVDDVGGLGVHAKVRLVLGHDRVGEGVEPRDQLGREGVAADGAEADAGHA